MARLVQGDVGSGKTALAIWSLLVVVAAGRQGALIAPTMTLAQQHRDTLEHYLAGSRVEVALVVAGSSAQQRELVATGQASVVVGTHALLSEKMEFADLALVVVDEEQRFGVQQRQQMAHKGEDVHRLHLSATPIPRSLALAIRGDFDPRFLELPKELLVMTMKHHQKYFPVSDGKGNLLPGFITISNMSAGHEIKNGNERVLRARLEDARFFYNEDKKKNLDDFVESLKGVVFQKKLGTLYEKMERICDLARILSTHACPDKEPQALRAGRLCKADLVTLMVYEFPELQGIMGGYYATHSGEEPTVAQAIQEHYRPAFAGDDPPASELGAVIAVADKLDTILGCIGVGLIPSGSEDPYGLRRNALGIIQIFLHRGWQVSLDNLVEEGLRSMGSKIKLDPETIKNHVMELFSQRYKTYLDAEGFPYDAIDCVLSTGLDSIVDIKAKVSAFSALKKQPYFEPLAIAFRRVVSILNDEAEGEVDTGLLNEPAEKKLFEEYLKVRDPVFRHIQNKEFSKALEKIAEIKPAVDSFFDEVMVMVEDVSLRKNRLCLLQQISGLFSELADFSRIVLKKS